MGGGQPHSEVDVLRVAKGLFNAEAPTIEFSYLAGEQVVSTCRKAPRVFHLLVMNEHDSRNGRLFLRHPHVLEHLGKARRSKPLRGGGSLASYVLDCGTLPESNH